jgi:hypothetical protein
MNLQEPKSQEAGGLMLNIGAFWRVLRCMVKTGEILRSTSELVLAARFVATPKSISFASIR